MVKMNISKRWEVQRLVATIAIFSILCGAVTTASGCAAFRDMIYLSEKDAIDIARRECKVEEGKVESYLVEADLLTWEKASARLNSSGVSKFPPNTQTWLVSFIEMHPLKAKEGTSAIPLTRCNVALDAKTGELMGIITTHRNGSQPASPTTTVQLEKPCEVINGERPDKPAFKGIELYSRQTENGEWLFTILYGTNRNKTVHEAGSGTMDFEEVKQCFCRLADGENVFWMDSAYNPETGEMISLPKPPPAIIKDIQDGAAACGVNLDPD